MGPKAKSDGDEKKDVRFPKTLTITDIVTLVSIALAVVGGWGVLTSRIAVLEAGQVVLTEDHKTDAADIKDLNNRLTDHITHPHH